MADKTKVYHVSFTTGADGAQDHAIVFKKPEQGVSYDKGHFIAFDENGASYAPGNDDGVVPHRERTSPGEDLGLTWQFSK